MKILLLCHSLRIKSEWLFRLIENFEDEIKCIGTNEPERGRFNWEQESLNPLSAKLIRKFNEDINRKFIYPAILSRTEIKYQTTVNYIHFIGFAVKLKEYINRSSSPSIIHCHGKDIMWDLKDGKTGKPFHDRKYYQDLEEISTKAFFIANSAFTRNQLLIKNIPENRIFINHFGIGLKPMIKKPIKGRFKILYLGRLVDFKGPLEVIEAFEKACDMGMKSELSIAGGGEMEQECRDRIDISPYKQNIKLLGWVNKKEAEKLYEEADIFTAHNKKDKYTNQVEAFGVSVIEAMSFGLPVVTGKSAGVNDSVVHNHTGYLIEPGNIEEHARKFFKLYQDIDLRKKFSLQARKRIAENFSPIKEKENLKKIFNEIKKIKTMEEAVY